MDDLRRPLGLLIAFYGVVLTLHGLVVGVRVLDVNVNLWWGVMLLGFGAVMLYLARRAKRFRQVRSVRL